MSEAAAFPPLTAEDVVWEGRPTLGVVRQDVWAGLTTLGVCWGVLGVGLVTQFGATLREGFQSGGVAAVVVAVIVILARALGASARIHGALAGFLAVAALAGLAREATAQVVCCGTALFPVGAALGWRARVRPRTRYTLTKSRGAIRAVSSTGEPNHVIHFTFAEPPRLHPDPFGSDLADVSFHPREARLETRAGKAFKLGSRVLRFSRVKDPQQLLQAIGAERPSPEAA